MEMHQIPRIVAVHCGVRISAQLPDDVNEAALNLNGRSSSLIG